MKIPYLRDDEGNPLPATDPKYSQWHKLEPEGAEMLAAALALMGFEVIRDDHVNAWPVRVYCKYDCILTWNEKEGWEIYTEMFKKAMEKLEQ